ncbi:catalase family peroxidase [Hyphomicrobium sp.]|uniref:catalase family peroxidase n=1 Tax=Hyphomicrobium sp. TaxID=82 RepID=UPI000FAF40EE|nr:catalase family peroxidase [Hyphomicrobium sp.]MBN9248101.1 catalase family peroxidase [Hyphomicrobium sp.]RUP08179.1 MAG: catalase family peroxidase [Hyphomicrobium sp.]
MVSNRLIAALAAAAVICVPMARACAEEADAESLVNALNAVFGKHPGVRAAHTHGICVKGNFVPSADAPSLTKAPHFNSKTPVGVIGRFSMGGGDPDAPNAQKDNVRGIAMHFDLGKGNNTDLLLISAPMFVAKDPDQFLKLLTTVATKDKEMIGAYFKDNPNSTRQAEWLNARPVPASYGSVNYWGVHAFTFTNADGKKQIFKYKALPVGGEVGISDDEAKKKDADFYRPELKDRLAKGPVQFTLTAILGEPGDPLDDPTALWPEDKRKSVNLGTISITDFEDAKTCDEAIFDPTNVVDGVEGPENDKIFPMRSQAYAVSFSRREAPQQ